MLRRIQSLAVLEAAKPMRHEIFRISWGFPHTILTIYFGTVRHEAMGCAHPTPNATLNLCPSQMKLPGSSKASITAG
jgi:hypothetical protein